MTKEEYDIICQMLNEAQTPHYPMYNNPQLVITQYSCEQLKQKLKTLIKRNKR